MSGQAEVTWYISRDGQQFGPYSGDEFDKFKASRQLADTDFVWRAGLDNWVTFAEYSSSFARDVIQAVEKAATPRPDKEQRLHEARLLLRKLARAPLEILATSYQLLSDPNAFGAKRIDAGPRDLYRASKFYLSLFALAFLIGASLTFLQFFSGSSEPRELVKLALQIGFAVPMLYVLNVAARQPIRFSGIAQAVLYVDGIYIVLEVLINALLACLSYWQASDRGELNLFSMEFEKCLANSSFVYWLIRGDLQFFSNSTTDAGILNVVRTNAAYVLIIPFCIVFAKLMKARYQASLWLNVLFAGMTYVTVVNGVHSALGWVEDSIKAKSPCAELSVKKVFATYSPAVVLGQIAGRANAELAKKPSAIGPWVTADANGLVIDLKLQTPTATEHLLETTRMASESSRALYCRGSGFWLARKGGFPLRLTVRNAEGTIIRQEHFTPASCTES